MNNLTVYFAKRLAGKVFSMSSFRSFFCELVQGATINFRALLNSFVAWSDFCPHPTNEKHRQPLYFYFSLKQRFRLGLVVHLTLSFAKLLAGKVS